MMDRVGTVLALVALSGAAAHGPRPIRSAGGPAQPPAGMVRSTAAMHEARAAHTATALPDGSVLIVGGFGADESRAAGAELFDSRAERFSPLEAEGVRRHSHSATRLADGRVLIAGGMANGRYLDTALLYDPATRTFNATGRMTVSRSNHEAVRLGDGRVLLIGGVGTGWTFLSSAEIWDPATGRFTPASGMAEPRESHVAVRLPDGNVLVAGGHRGRRSEIVISRTAEIYDVEADAFRAIGSMTIRRHKADAVALADGRVLILGGADERDSRGVYESVEAFDPASGRFRAGSPMRVGRYKHRGTSFLLPDGVLLLAGGATRAEEYDVGSGASRLVAGEAEMAGQFSAAVPLPDGRVLITGGYGEGRGPGSGAWLYEPGEPGRRQR